MIKKISIIVLLKFLFTSAVSYCQNADEKPFGIDFLNPWYFQINYSIPGARANSLGGAFIGVADDATAASINPAGLTILRDPETSAHIRLSRPGISGLYGDAVLSGEKTEYSLSRADLSYGSVVFPLEKFALALAAYWDIEMSAAYNFEYQQSSSAAIPNKHLSNFDLKITNAGIAASHHIIPQRLRIGLSFQLTTLSIYLSELQYFTQISKDLADDIAEINNKAPNEYSIKLIRDSNVQPGFKVGLLFNPFANNNFRIGFVYNYRNNYFNIKSKRFFPDVKADNWMEDEKTSTIKIKLPDFYGIGFYYELTNWLGFSTDVVYI